MSAQPSLQTSDSSEPLSAERSTSRWAARLRELAPDRLPNSADSPEIVSLRPHRRLWDRVQRGVAVPAAAAAAAFVLTIVVSIAMVWLQPHTVSAASEEMLEGQVGGPAPTNTSEAAHTGELAGTDADSERRVYAGSDSQASAPIYVHVVGEVAKPGVYELEADSRVLAAIDAAGGATDGAVLSALNLARPLSDGEQVSVPNADTAASLAASGMTVTGGALGRASAGGSATTNGLVNLNAADLAALETLPRVGPALAQRILDWREANGGFDSPDQLLGVSGIGAKTFEQLQHLVTI